MKTKHTEVARSKQIKGVAIKPNLIKTHDSESQSQEEVGRKRRTSELFTRSTALKFVNALNKPP